MCMLLFAQIHSEGVTIFEKRRDFKMQMSTCGKFFILAIIPEKSVLK